VPYDQNSELPQSVRDHLPDHAQTIYREAFNHAWVQYAQDPAQGDRAPGRLERPERKYRKARDR
jgi:cation transport regulator